MAERDDQSKRHLDADQRAGAGDGPLPGRLVAQAREALEAVADRERAETMSAYLRHQFPFLGVATPERRAAQKPVLSALSDVDGETLLAWSEACWREPERELQYLAADGLRRYQKALGRGGSATAHLQRIRGLVVTRSWWDTVDSLGPHTVGPLVRRHAELVAVMDDWIDDTDRWLVRTALLHQLMAGSDADPERLFRHARRRETDRDPFVAKAVGWALRQYGRVDPDAVRAFVADRGERLSPLARREALKRL